MDKTIQTGEIIQHKNAETTQTEMAQYEKELDEAFKNLYCAFEDLAKVRKIKEDRIFKLEQNDYKNVIIRVGGVWYSAYILDNLIKIEQKKSGSHYSTENEITITLYNGETEIRQQRHYKNHVLVENKRITVLDKNDIIQMKDYIAQFIDYAQENNYKAMSEVLNKAAEYVRGLIEKERKDSAVIKPRDPHGMAQQSQTVDLKKIIRRVAGILGDDDIYDNVVITAYMLHKARKMLSGDVDKITLEKALDRLMRPVYVGVLQTLIMDYIRDMPDEKINEVANFVNNIITNANEKLACLTDNTCDDLHSVYKEVENVIRNGLRSLLLFLQDINT